MFPNVGNIQRMVDFYILFPYGNFKQLTCAKNCYES